MCVNWTNLHCLPHNLQEEEEAFGESQTRLGDREIRGASEIQQQEIMGIPFSAI